MDGEQKGIFSNDEGIAWGLAAVFMMIFLGGAYYLFNLPIFNGLIRAINNYVTLGQVSQQTANTLSFGQNVIVFFPAIMLLGFFAWIIVRSHQKREY